MDVQAVTVPEVEVDRRIATGMARATIESIESVTGEEGVTNGDGGAEIEARDGEPEPDPSDDGDTAAMEGCAGTPVEEVEGGGEDVVGVEGRLDSIVESLLLAAGSPLPVRRMVDVVGGAKGKDIRAALARLMDRYSGEDRGIHLVEVAGGFQFRTAPGNARFVRTLLREKPSRLGRAALETLSIVAYKQPVTRGDIEAIRGVDADSAINTLLARRLIKIDGRRETVGRPLLYATTPEFLEVFGLKDLRELPTLKEIGPVPEPEYEAQSEEEDDDGNLIAAAIGVGSAAGTAAAGAQRGGAACAEEPDVATVTDREESGGGVDGDFAAGPAATGDPVPLEAEAGRGDDDIDEDDDVGQGEFADEFDDEDDDEDDDEEEDDDLADEDDFDEDDEDSGDFDDEDDFDFDDDDDEDEEDEED